MPYFNGLKEYCEENTIGECNQRTEELELVKRIEQIRFEMMYDRKIKNKVNHFTYDSCQDSDSDCSILFDEDTRTYIHDPEERKRRLDLMDEKNREIEKNNMLRHEQAVAKKALEDAKHAEDAAAAAAAAPVE